MGAATASGGAGAAVTFANVNPGPVPCPAGTLSTTAGAKIVTTVAGWDAVDQTTAGTTGRDVESPRDFEERRRASVAVNAQGPVPSVRGAVLGTAGVLDAYVVDNPSGSARTVGGVSLPPHSLYVSVTGGADMDVAVAIFVKKAPGCDMSGNTTVNVPDMAYLAPQPTYPITFQRATPTPVYVSVTLVNGPGVPADVVTRVRNAVLGAFSGTDRGPRARIGQALYAVRFVSAVSALGPWAQVFSVTIGLTPGAPGASVMLPISQQPTLGAADVSVTLA
jgi:hypothetical protein